jgi:ABC-type sugar transport system ATPase subunit
MVGRQYMDEDVYVPRELGETILELKKYSGQGFQNIDLSVRKGEVVAFTGLAGCGASDLMQTMFGSLPSEGGHMLVNGKELDGRIVQFMRKGVAMLPANRKENSVVPDMSILENFYLAEHNLSRGRKPFIRVKTEKERYEAQKESLHIKAPDSANSILSLSGGNQQKVFLARWLNTGADVLLFDNPTQGVDVGAKEEIYKLILDFAEAGKTVLCAEVVLDVLVCVDVRNRFRCTCLNRFEQVEYLLFLCHNCFLVLIYCFLVVFLCRTAFCCAGGQTQRSRCNNHNFLHNVYNLVGYKSFIGVPDGR